MVSCGILSGFSECSRGALAPDESKDRRFVLGRWIGDTHVEKEPVHLGFGQGIRALLLDRVLSGENQKKLRELVGRARDGHLTFLHCLKQCCLNLGGRAVDLVGQHEVSENRTWLEIERGVLLTIDLRAGDIARKQVGRELHPAEITFDQITERLDRPCLGDAGKAFHQDVTIGEESNEQALHHLLLSDDGGIHPGGDLFEGFAWIHGFRI